MAITTVDGYVAAAKQRIQWVKTASRTGLTANQQASTFELAGLPGAGTLAGTSTTTGTVPTDATAGCPTIFFSTGTGYVTNVRASSSVAGIVTIYDMLWKGGAYAFNVSTTGNTPTSFLSRIPGGTAADTSGCTELWIEQVTTGTGVQNVNVSYTNSAGTTGRTTGVTAAFTGATVVGSMWQLPLQAGDSGLTGVTSVTGSVATAGTFNILVLRPLWSGRVTAANDQINHGIDLTGMPVVFSDSALIACVRPDSTATGLPNLTIEIANG